MKRPFRCSHVWGECYNCQIMSKCETRLLCLLEDHGGGRVPSTVWKLQRQVDCNDTRARHLSSPHVWQLVDNQRFIIV